MATETFQTGPAPKIIVQTVGGKLRVRSHESETVEIRSRDNGELTAEEKKGQVLISCETDCQLLVPPQASLEAELVGGDVSLMDIEGDAMIETVGGSLRAKRVGGVSLKTIGGDLSARKLGGALSADSLGGDALIDQVSGELRLRKVGGDLRLSRVEGLVEASAGGDGRVSLSPSPDLKYGVSVGGDLSCYIPEGSSAHFKLKAGGDLRLAVPVEAKDLPGGYEVILGAGEAELELSAGGVLSLRTGEESDSVVAVDLGEAIADRVGAEIETHMAEIEDRLSGLGDRLQAFDSSRIGSRIRRSIAKAQRKAARAQRKAARAQLRAGSRVHARAAAGRGRAASDSIAEERLVVLRMVEEGKISVDEAESLLEALED